MTLKEKFDNVEIMFENQIGSLKYDELSEASNQCEKIADDFAIGFADWCKEEYELEDTSFHNKWRDVNGEYRETKEILKMYKIEKGL